MKTSHGFRPNKGVHSALKTLYMQGANFSWCINGDITKCFDSIPHDIIMRLIKKKIKCARTLETLQKALKNPSIKDGKIIESKKGTSQGSIVSPILANIVLNELDKFMELKKISFETGKRRRRNPIYHSLETTRLKSRNPILRKEKLKLMMNTDPKDPRDPNFKRLLYVRYADDFVILLISDQATAYTIRRSIKDFLKNKLGIELNIEKTSISNIKDGFKFLGALVSRKKQVIRKVTKNIGKTIKFRKRISRRLIINAPLTDLITKLKSHGFTRNNKENVILAKNRGDLINLSHYQILQFYNSRIRGLLNFYSFASNYPQLRRVIWLLEQSCALTLALKYKLKTMNKTFNKFGRHLTDPETGISIYHERNMKVKHDFKIKQPESHELDKILDGSPHTTLTVRVSQIECAICGSKDNVEMHHLRKAKDIIQMNITHLDSSDKR